jgi:O-antigen/teichoic acid export membrane protein
MSSLKKLAIRGTIWTLVGYGGSQTLRLGSNIILTRLLVPEMFGLMALVNTFIIGLNLFSDLGIQPSIIRSERWNDPVFLNTAWTLQVIRGFGLWLATFAIAWPVAHFYGNSQLLWILPIVGLTTVMNGFASTAPATLNRKLEVGKLTGFNFGIQIISLSVMIVWAYLRQTIWALVGGGLVSTAVKTVWSHRLEPEIRNRFAWDKKALKELASFGRWIFLSTLMTFFAEQTDRILLGKLLSLEILGVYTIAFTFSDIPRQIVLQMSGQVIFPAISQLAALPRESLRAKVLAKRWWLLVGMAILLTFLVSFGDLIILALYDRRYAQAAWMLPILALGFWPSVLAITNGSSLLAISKPVYVAFAHIFKAIYMVVGLPLGVFKMGVLGAIIVIAFNDLPLYGAISYGLWREQLSTIQQDLQATGLLLGLLALILAGRYIWGFRFPIEGLF